MAGVGEHAVVAEIQAAVPAWLAVFTRRRAALGPWRRRWAERMTAALGPGFVAGDELFINHAVLVRVAQWLVARMGGAPLGWAGVMDWPEAVPEGQALVDELGEVLGGFDWDAVERDVLREVYEAVVSASTRKSGGEFYTPDGLAARMIEEAPRGVVMDPSCGSGTFLFHAVRRLVNAGMPAAEVVGRVRGMDVHPVAVALARANYLLAIGRERLRGEGVEVPVVEGDAIGSVHGGEEGRVDALIGNPPWLAYRFMPAEVQARFHAACVEEGLWGGGTVSTHQDLAGLFVVRAVRRYLREGGWFGFVMPGAVLDRAQFAGLRAGRELAFAGAWDLRRVRPHVFPVGAAVIFGRRAQGGGAALRATEVWSGKWSAVRRGAADEVRAATRSAYHARFRQGATLVPRVLVIVKRGADGRVRSARSEYEKRPWRELADLEGAVEAECLWPVVLGEHLAPYRVSAPALAVLPTEGASGKVGFIKWWAEAEARWAEHRASERLTLRGQLDYQQKLASQHPVAPLRVVYTKSGMHLAAAKLVGGRAIVDHTLYWAAAGSVDEADYLCAVLNAAVVTRMVRPWMAYGKDERHIDKHVWRLPIPLFDPEDPAHVRLVAAARRAEAEIAGRAVKGGCVAVRREIRGFLAESAVGREIEGLVAGLLGAT